jgi:hypothetical protein
MISKCYVLIKKSKLFYIIIQCVQKVWKQPNKIEANDFLEKRKTGELAFSKSFFLLFAVFDDLERVMMFFKMATSHFYYPFQ